MGITQYFRVGKKTKDGLVPMRLEYAIPFCNRCGKASELVKVHDLELCPRCAEEYGEWYSTSVKAFMETKANSEKKEKTKGKKK